MKMARKLDLNKAAMYMREPLKACKIMLCAQKSTELVRDSA